VNVNNLNGNSVLSFPLHHFFPSVGVFLLVIQHSPPTD
jgi:hypothetical protein